jgi:2-isopropylmalate synthase
MLKDRRTYEILDAASVGARSSLSIGRNSGRHAVIARAHDLGISVADADRTAFAAAVADYAQTRAVVSDAELVTIAARMYGGSREPIAV